MVRKLASWCVVGVLAACMVPKVQGQDAYAELALRHSRAHTYHEAFVLPGKEAPSLVVTWRIPNSLLVFVRDQTEGGAQPFVAEAEVTVQLYRAGEKVVEEVWRATRHAATFEETQSRVHDLEGAVSFAVPPGTYGYRLMLKDAFSDAARQSLLNPVVVPDFGTERLARAFFARSVHAGDTMQVRLANLGGDVPYGAAAQALVPVVLPAGASPEAATLRYTLYRSDPAAVRAAARAEAEVRRRGRRAEGEALPVRHADLAEPEVGEALRSGAVAPAAWLPVPPASAVTHAAGRLRWTPPPQVPAGYVVPVDLAGGALPDGAYVLEVTVEAGGQTATTRTPFQTHWREMPRSLYHPEVAIRNLSFIEARAVIRSMLKGSAEEQEAHIRAYWKQRDPSPATEFNELMAEYYRRIDHAATAFQTGRYPFPDGLETDRARIYVLHGPAEQVERTFPAEGGVEEIWTYADGRRFVFWSPNSLDAFHLREEAR